MTLSLCRSRGIQVPRLRRDRANYGAEKTTRGSARNDGVLGICCVGSLHSGQKSRHPERSIFASVTRICVVEGPAFSLDHTTLPLRSPTASSERSASFARSQGDLHSLRSGRGLCNFAGQSEGSCTYSICIVRIADTRYSSRPRRLHRVSFQSAQWAILARFHRTPLNRKLPSFLRLHIGRTDEQLL